MENNHLKAVEFLINLRVELKRDAKLETLFPPNFNCGIDAMFSVHNLDVRRALEGLYKLSEHGFSRKQKRWLLLPKCTILNRMINIKKFLSELFSHTLLPNKEEVLLKIGCMKESTCTFEELKNRYLSKDTRLKDWSCNFRVFTLKPKTAYRINNKYWNKHFAEHHVIGCELNVDSKSGIVIQKIGVMNKARFVQLKDAPID